MEEEKNPPPPEKKLWFRAKTYGYGWYPSAWQGWALVISYIIFVVFAAWDILRGASVGGEAVKRFVLTVLVLSFFLVYFSYKHGERPRWRWGKEEEGDKTRHDTHRPE